MNKQLTQEEIKRVLHYNPDTGIFRWKVRKSHKSPLGSAAGGLRTDGYHQISINGKIYLSHRLAHLYMEGYFPEHDIDHKKRVRADNRWSQIRCASKSCNAQNTKIRSTNSSGFPGVTWDKQNRKWRSQIVINWKSLCLGTYSNTIDAALARFTTEMQCDKWTCNYESELFKAIKKAWPEFNPLRQGE